MPDHSGTGLGFTHVIAHALNVADAQDALTELQRAIDKAKSSKPLALDLSGSEATAPALQLLIAGARKLSATGASGGLGPHAARALDALSIKI